MTSFTSELFDLLEKYGYIPVDRPLVEKLEIKINKGKKTRVEINGLFEERDIEDGR